MKSRIFRDGIGDLLRLTRVAGLSLWIWVIPALLLISASALEGVSIGMIAPFIELLAKKGDLASLMNASPAGMFLQWFPEMRIRHVLLGFLAFLCLITTLKNMLMMASSLFTNRVTRLIEDRIRTRIYDRYLSFGQEFFDKSKIGDLMNLATSQVTVAADVFRFVHYFFSNAFLSLVYLGLMLYISWKLTLSAFLFIPLMYAVISVLSKKIAKSTQVMLKIDQEMNSYMLDSLTNMSLIKSSVTESAESARYRDISRRSALNLYSVWKKIICAPLIQDTILTYETAALVFVCVAVFMKGQNEFGLGAFLTFFIVLRRFASTAGQAGVNATEISRHFVPIRKILEIFENTGKSFIRSGTQPFTGLKRNIQFENVGFKYAEGPEILRQINLTIEKGRMTAIVGPTGAGKTTLINLLMRYFDPTKGVIRLDGMDIREYETASILKKIALVDQNARVFNKSIGENIVYGHDSIVDQAALDMVARQSSLYDFIQALPNRYDTFIGDRGVRLSGGERQRLAIARAILKNPDIYIFDEATSSLDAQTELSIQQAIENATKGKTVVVIAHRLSTIKNADHIIVVQAGVVVEQGTFAELVSQNGAFRKYWDLLLQEPQKSNLPGA